MDAVTQRWVERAGLRFEADGLPRTAGRIVAYLMLSPGARSLDELAADLQVSKASASTNTSLLERLGAIERETRAGDRRDFFRIRENLHVRMLEHWLTGMRDTRAVLGAVLEEGGPPLDEPVRQRLETLWVFFDHMLEEIEGAGERWMQDHERERAGADSLATKP